MPSPRVALFPDSFHEVNGVAHTSRNFQGFAERRNLPLLCVRAAAPGVRSVAHQISGSIETLDLPRASLSVRLENDLQFDLFFGRHARTIARTLRGFRPDLIHITGPSELGMLGAYFAWRMGIPLAASWHTNVHEYAATRMASITVRFAGPGLNRAIERHSLSAAMRLYRLARVLFAPNDELCAMLSAATGKPCHLMQRGVDTILFAPRDRNTEEPNDEPMVLGFVGRLSVEKNVALLPRIARELAGMTTRPIRFLIVGQGAEEQALRRELPHAEFAGVLRGQELARAYAKMDILLFPSHTDTFGNVVLEALASGVPAIVTPDGGPKYIVRQGETGFIVPDEGFAEAIVRLAQDPRQMEQMGHAARAYAETCTWDAVFESVYTAYDAVLPHEQRDVSASPAPAQG